MKKENEELNVKENIDEKKEKVKKNPNAFLGILAVLILIGIGVWYYFYWQGITYFTTENSKVTADLYTVMPNASGKLVKLNIEKNCKVKQDEVVGRVENGPYIKSPVNGQVVKCDVVLNQQIANSVPVAVIADTNNIFVGANIEETDIVKIKEGQSVDVKLDAYPNKTFKGHVKEINKVTQTAITGNAMSFTTSGTYTKVTQLIPVKIIIDDKVNLDGLIGTNSTVKIKIR